MAKRAVVWGSVCFFSISHKTYVQRKSTVNNKDLKRGILEPSKSLTGLKM